jgi:hypothetical protein
MLIEASAIRRGITRGYPPFFIPFYCVAAGKYRHYCRSQAEIIEERARLTGHNRLTNAGNQYKM